MLISQTDPTDNNAKLCEMLLSSKTALFVGAHPDDIEFRAGGLVYLMRQCGVEVTFAIGTRGGKGLPGPLRRTLERVRTRHQMCAAEIMGGVEVIFYDYPDGMLSYYQQPFADNLKQLLSIKQPNIVLCWDPDFIFTPHPDHQASANAARLASDGFKTCFYGTLKPNLWIGLDDDALNSKILALKAHKTETPWFYFDLRQKQWLISGLRAEGAKIGCDYAETFRVSL